MSESNLTQTVNNFHPGLKNERKTLIRMNVYFLENMFSKKVAFLKFNLMLLVLWFSTPRKIQQTGNGKRIQKH